MCVHMPGSSQDNSPIQDAARASFPGLLGRGGGAAPQCLLLTSPSRTGKGEWGPHPIPASPLPHCFLSLLGSWVCLPIGTPARAGQCRLARLSCRLPTAGLPMWRGAEPHTRWSQGSVPVYPLSCMFLCVHGCVLGEVCPCEPRFPQMPEECVRSPGAGVLGCCELSDMGVGDITL